MEELKRQKAAAVAAEDFDKAKALKQELESAQAEAAEAKALSRDRGQSALHYSVGEAALRRLRPRARQIPDVARPALLNASVPRAAARALWAQASSEFFGHWDAEIFSDAARCADWFTQTPSECDAPLAFLHMAGYGNKKFRPMLLRLLSKRRANFSAAVAHGVCFAMAEVIADIDHRNGNR